MTGQRFERQVRLQLSRDDEDPLERLMRGRTTLVVAPLTTQLLTSDVVFSPDALYRAIAPATCGEAIEVPLMVS